jgi:hypothetical protein
VIPEYIDKMINSTKTRKNFITPEKAASLIPIFISLGISILIITFFVMPQYFKSTKVNFELNGLIRKKRNLDNLKSEYKIINQKFDKLNQEKTKIIELVTGNTNLNTLLDKLGEIARRNNVEFVSIVPLKLMNYEENTKEKNNVQTNETNVIVTDPLLVKGSKKYVFDLIFKTEFINLLSFLRELEFLESVILINDINLELLSQNSTDDEISDLTQKIEVKINTSFYGRL